MPGPAGARVTTPARKVRLRARWAEDRRARNDVPNTIADCGGARLLCPASSARGCNGGWGRLMGTRWRAAGAVMPSPRTVSALGAPGVQEGRGGSFLRRGAEVLAGLVPPGVAGDEGRLGCARPASSRSSCQPRPELPEVRGLARPQGILLHARATLALWTGPSSRTAFVFREQVQKAGHLGPDKGALERQTS